MLQDEIENIRNHALVRLNDAQDYYTHSEAVWRILQQAVQRQQFTFVLHNRLTDSRVTEEELMPLVQKYVAEELLPSSLQKFVSIFENFLYDVLKAWLLAHPKSLSKRQLSGRDIFDLPDKTAIIDALVEKELREVFYDRPANWFVYLNKLVNVGVPTVDDREQFAEIKARRDVLVHGQGVANEYYISKAGSAYQATVGQSLEITEPYHRESWRLICRVVKEIGDGLSGKAST